MRYFLAAAATLGAAALATPANAAQYMFEYGFNGAKIASGTITTDNTVVQPGAKNVVDITGNRVSTGNIDGFDYYADYGDQLIFPANASAKVDGSGITYQIGNYSYNLYSQGSGFYSEFRYLTSDPDEPGVGTAVSYVTLTEITAAAVPEPATWAMMIAGFGVAGASLRRARRARLRAATA